MSSHIGSQSDANHKRLFFPQSQLMKIPQPQHNVILLIRLRLCFYHKIIPEILFRRFQLHDRDLRQRSRADKTRCSVFAPGRNSRKSRSMS